MKRFFMKFRRHVPAINICLFLIFFLVAFAGRAQNARHLLADQKAASIKASLNARAVEMDLMRLTPASVSFQANGDAFYAATNGKSILQKTLSLRNGTDEMRSFQTTDANAGVVIEKSQQYYKGIKVEHGRYALVSKGGMVQVARGEYYDIPSLAVVPLLTEAQALQKALTVVDATKYIWQDIDEQRKLATNPAVIAKLDKAYQEYYPKGELVIVDDYDTKDASDPDLAYKFNIYALAPLSRAYIYINAHTGKVMLRDAIIKHASVPTTLPTRYAGNRVSASKSISGNDPNSGLPLISSTTGLPVIGSTYILADDARGTNGGIETFDLNAVGGLPISVPGIYALGKSFTDADNNWTLAEHNRGGTNLESENDDYAFDAHWGAQIVYDYWNIVHNRKSYDNANAGIKSFVHYGAAYDNAFWNGTAMTYGDGSFQGGLQVGFAPLTSLDVCGHEIGHGVCSFTADLVYAGESGAMNEGYSDVWAACIENYVLTTVDPTLAADPTTRPNGYKVWSIGEQIDANDATGTAPNMINKPSSDPTSTALRYMDNPNKAGDPMYYFENSTRWTEPNCTPTLVNDQCGVHTNSGVLNRYFYLLTMGGSGTISTNDATNPTVALLDGQAYTVVGLGFAKSQKIAYLTELMLGPNATYTEARNAAIQAAQILYGQCSFEEQQTWNAWNGVAVGIKWQGCTAPTFSANIATTVLETAAGDNCTAKTDLPLEVNIISPGNANPVTVTITQTGGTATLGKDFTLSTTNITYNANESGRKEAILSVLNDAEVEGTETIQITITATDGAAFNFTVVRDITITDDDVTPIIGNNRVTLLNENFDAAATGGLPTGWTSIDKLGTNLMRWVVGQATYPVTTMFNTKALYADEIDPVIQIIQPLYALNAGANIIAATPTINATGLTDIQLKFDYSAGGELDPGAGALDYGSLKYSFDGTNYLSLSDITPVFFNQLTATTATINLPVKFNNRSFRLGFEWYNDANATTNPKSFEVDNVVVTGGYRKVATTTGDLKSETVYSGKDIYFLSRDNGRVISRIRNPNQDLGCITSSLIDSGNTIKTMTIQGNSSPRTAKVFKITPSVANGTASYELTLYFTSAELAVWGNSKLNLKLLKMAEGTNINSDDFTAANSRLIAPTAIDHPTEGYIEYKATITDGFSNFVLVSPTLILPIDFVDFTIKANASSLLLDWNTGGSGSAIAYYAIERRKAGSGDFAQIAKVAATNGGRYTYNDAAIDLNTVYEYRIRQVDAANRAVYSPIRTGTVLGKRKLEFTVAPSPVRQGTNAKLIFNKPVNDARLQILSINGGILSAQNIISNTNNNVFECNTAKLQAGTYFVKVMDRDEVIVKKLIVQ